MKRSPPKNKEGTFQCPKCVYIGKSERGLKRHTEKKHQSPARIIEQTKAVVSPQEEKFCRIYASDKEFFGNGVQSYIEAFNIDVGKGVGKRSYEYCRWAASNLLRRRYILDRINDAFEASGLNDSFVDKQLEKLITQDAEFRPKLGAIQEYNKLKKRTSDQVQHVHAFADVSSMSDEALELERTKLDNFFKKK